jgi:hypothetical protein
MSIIRQTVESIAKKLQDHAYFRTVPLIPVLVEDAKTIERDIENHMQHAGVFVLVSFGGGNSDNSDSPQAYIPECQFNVTVNEIPSIWRQQKGTTPSATEIAETCARILHFHKPLDKSGNALSGGVLIYKAISPQANDSFIQQQVEFTTTVAFPNTQPTRS